MWVFFCSKCSKKKHLATSFTHANISVLLISYFQVQDQPEHHDDRLKRAEFSLPTWLVLNALELMGFKVVTSGPYVTGMAKHDQREFVWTLHKTHDEWESSSK